MLDLFCTGTYTLGGIGYYHPELFSRLSCGKRALAPTLFEAMNGNKISGELYSGDWRDIAHQKGCRSLIRI